MTSGVSGETTPIVAMLRGIDDEIRINLVHNSIHIAYTKSTFLLGTIAFNIACSLSVLIRSRVRSPHHRPFVQVFVIIIFLLKQQKGTQKRVPYLIYLFDIFTPQSELTYWHYQIR